MIAHSLGCAYNFCCYHDSLRLAAPENTPRKWQERTPAMAAGLTEHRWTRRELVPLKVPLPAWVAPKRQGPPPKMEFLGPLIAVYSRVWRKWLNVVGHLKKPVNVPGDEVYLDINVGAGPIVRCNRLL
jgi:hypothetical protein